MHSYNLSFKAHEPVQYSALSIHHFNNRCSKKSVWCVLKGDTHDDGYEYPEYEWVIFLLCRNPIVSLKSFFWAFMSITLSSAFKSWDIRGGSHGYTWQERTWPMRQNPTTISRHINGIEIILIDHWNCRRSLAEIIKCTNTTPSLPYYIQGRFCSD